MVNIFNKLIFQETTVIEEEEDITDNSYEDIAESGERSGSGLTNTFLDSFEYTRAKESIAL